MKMLANLSMQNQQLLQQHLHLQQQTAGAADNRGLHQQMAARDGGRVQESGGARNGRFDDSSGPLVRGTSRVKPESLSGEGRQASLAGSYPGFRVAVIIPDDMVLMRCSQGRMSARRLT